MDLHILDILCKWNCVFCDVGLQWSRGSRQRVTANGYEASRRGDKYVLKLTEDGDTIL